MHIILPMNAEITSFPMTKAKPLLELEKGLGPYLKPWGFLLF